MDHILLKKYNGWNQLLIIYKIKQTIIANYFVEHETIIKRQ